MSFTSYAQNFEDVLLMRALREVDQGFYVDVGAGDPRRHSVTQAFYERGWRGINLEPAPSLQRRLRIERPADINLPLAAAAEAGERTLYEVPGALLSTLDEARGRELGAQGNEVILRQVKAASLDAICTEHAAPVIHFLKIDTGGGEEQVLQGFDLARWQPWILVVTPGCRAMAEAAGYELAHEDGLNLFYTAPGKPELKAALALPPHPADGFVLCEDHEYSHPLREWRERTAAAEAAADEARTWAKNHVKEWQEKHALLTKQEKLTQKAEAELAVMTQRAAAAEGQIPPLTARATHAGIVELELKKAYEQIEALNNSLSWRITKPLRDGKAFVERIKGGVRRRLARVRALLVRIVKGLLRRAIQFVLSRPALAFFVRRQIARFPRLVQVARRLLMRGSQQGAAAPEPLVMAAGLEDLPEGARQVWQDLQRGRR
ncbi:FkbM family methyltransferase [Massilia endophytica]|uniref:FkbM family methyltransferase n=1 Tax=Massilia endophytica TaxID=2899220 RepID=UPI001E4B1E33|nr:FkbM family methyltransferase [Massilia endophytica]UGQ45482.1 FkbM family methyltransferase [Massilia endophytica]